MKIWHSNKNNWIHNILSSIIRLYSWKLHVSTKYAGFDKWKCSCSQATINIRFNVAKWHGKPKHKEHIVGKPKLDWNKRQGIVSKNIEHRKIFFVIAATEREFWNLPFCWWCKQRGRGTPFFLFFVCTKKFSSVHLFSHRPLPLVFSVSFNWEFIFKIEIE